MYFEAKLSGVVKGITVAVLALLLFVLVGGLYYTMRAVSVGDIALAVVGFIYGVLFVVGLGFLVVRDWVFGYKLDLDRLEIVRRWQENEIISLMDCEIAECVKNPFNKTIMLGGTGGVCGIYGDFKQLGGSYFTAYVTDTTRCVMLHMKGDRKIVVSPYERERFLAMIVELRPDVQVKTA